MTEKSILPTAKKKKPKGKAPAKRDSTKLARALKLNLARRKEVNRNLDS